MLFSVVIPLYNKADTIERSIRSVWVQTFNDYELIVVNDGSTDGSLDVVKRLSQEKDFVIIDKNNGGVSSARNAGADAASGQYIALLDGDDVWYPRHLERIQKAIESHPDVKFFGGGYELYRGRHVYYTIPWGGCVVKSVYSALQYGQPFNSSTVVIDRKLWQLVGGFDEQFAFYEDYEFFFRLGLHTKCCIVRQFSAVYQDDATSRATKSERELSRITRPHLVFIENQMEQGTATRAMRKFAQTYVLLSWAMSVCNGSSNKNDELFGSFPLLVKMLSPKKGRLGAQECNKLLALIIICYYRMRNHLIIWRRGTV